MLISLYHCSPWVSTSCLNRVSFPPLYYSPPLNVLFWPALFLIWPLPMESENALELCDMLCGITRWGFVLVHKVLWALTNKTKEEIKTRPGYNKQTELTLKSYIKKSSRKCVPSSLIHLLPGPGSFGVPLLHLKSNAKGSSGHAKSGDRDFSNGRALPVLCVNSHHPPPPNPVSICGRSANTITAAVHFRRILQTTGACDWCYTQLPLRCPAR